MSNVFDTLAPAAGLAPNPTQTTDNNVFDTLTPLAGGQSSGGPVNWGALAQMAAMGLTAADVYALGNQQAGGAGGGTANVGAANFDASGAPFGSTANTIGLDALQLVNQDYPALSWMLNIPGLSNVIIQAAQQGLSGADLQTEIQGTQWWQSQSAQAKQFFAEEMSGDNVDAQNMLNAQEASISQTFAQLGVTASTNQVQTFAWASLVNGWTTAQTTENLGRAITVDQNGNLHLNAYYTNAAGQQIDAVTGQPYTGQQDTLLTSTNRSGQTVITGVGQAPVDWAALSQLAQAGLTQSDVQALAAAGQTPTVQSQYGQVQSLEQNLTSLAKQYLVPTNPQTVGQWVQGAIQSGESASQAEQAYQAYLQNTAISQYPWMQQGIQAGQTPLSLVSPYANMLSSELGISPNNIDWTQPQYAKLLSTPDPKTGAPTQNPIWKATQTVRSDPSYGWTKTPGAVQAAYSFVQGMQETMGTRSYGGQTPGNISMPASFGSSGG